MFILGIVLYGLMAFLACTGLYFWVICPLFEKLFDGIDWISSVFSYDNEEWNRRYPRFESRDFYRRNLCTWWVSAADKKELLACEEYNKNRKH